METILVDYDSLFHNVKAQPMKHFVVRLPCARWYKRPHLENATKLLTVARIIKNIQTRVVARML